MTGKRLVAGAALSAATAFGLFLGFIESREGTVYKAYQDSIGVWTICTGDTEDVKPHMVETEEGCRKRLEKDARYAWEEADRQVTAPMTLYQQWAYADYIFNAGPKNFATSTMRRQANLGNVKASCEAFLLHYKAGGRDCRIKANNCRGVWLRRQAEFSICMGAP